MLLFRGGAPGECDQLGKAEKLPNYFDLFLPAANSDSEFILAFNFAGTGSGQSEELMRDFGGRSIAFSQGWINPRFALANRYQSTITGDFCDSLIQMTPDKGGRTAVNSAINPASYENRDYRMKATMLWDFEKIAGISTDGRTSTGWVPFIYKTDAVPNYEIDGEYYTTYESGGCITGYMFRKFIRDYPGQARSEGNFNWPVIRLADVYLMYAEAVNFAGLSDQKDYAVEMVNRVRRRGNLPDLKSNKTVSQEEFFKAIEQERIVELVAEGHRSFDIRRWRKIEEVFCPPFDPDGYRNSDTWGNPVTGYSSNGIFFQNQAKRAYERCYIFAIPESERNKNSNLTQNTPFR